MFDVERRDNEEVAVKQNEEFGILMDIHHISDIRVYHVYSIYDYKFLIQNLPFEF